MSASGTDQNIYRINGTRAQLHRHCADSYRTDREYGLIYPSFRVIDADGTSKVMGVDAASIACGFCAYCQAEEKRS